MRFNHSRQTESTSTGRRVHDDTDAAEPDDDIGIVAALSAVPPDALGAMFEARLMPSETSRTTSSMS